MIAPTSPLAPNTSPAERPPPRMVWTPLGRVEYAQSGGGAAVLCLHGAMGGHDQGTLLASVLGEAGYRYVSVSRPGYLQTPLSSGRSPEAQADLCAALLDALSIDRAAVMAVSGGGPCAIHFALRHPSRCWALVMVSAPGGQTHQRPPLAFTVMKTLAKLPWVAARMQRKAAANPLAAARRSITDPELLARTLRDDDAWRLLQELQRSTSDRMAERIDGTDNDVAVSLSRSYPLEEVRVPTLVLHGTRDPLLPFEEHGASLARRIVGAELVALEGGEHAAIFSHRQQARAAVTRFLRRHAPGAPPS